MYTLFAGDSYYPRGGMNDRVGTFETLKEAVKYFEEGDFDWGHVTVGLEVIKTFYK